MTFSELGLRDNIVSAIKDLGFVQPTPIQEQAIPYLLQNEGDLIGLASTGTGKTAAFGLPMLEIINSDNSNVQGLIVCPTRELCIQISKDLDTYAANIKNLKTVSVYGGSDIKKQINQIDRGAQIVIATPGRLIDLINRKKVKLGNVQIVVLDEADEMLNMGFKEDIDQILEQTPEFKSVWLFSATMPKEVARIAKNYMIDPFEITVGGKNETNKNIEHHYYVLKERDRYAGLKRLIDINPDIYGLIFCRTKRETAAVADKLMADGYNAEPLHGDLSQAQRDRVMGKFRDKTLQILVATDVAARGIDVDDITHVIHYNLPEDVENYTHRSGRTARAGKKGISIALINGKEGRRIKAIEKMINTSFELKSIPSADQVCETRLLNLIDNLEEVEVNHKAIDKYMPQILEKLDNYSKEELIQRFISAEFNRFVQYYNNSQDLNEKESSSSRSDRDRGRRNERNKQSKGKQGRNFNSQDSQRFFVSLGKKDGFNQGALLRMLCDSAGVEKNSIGKIDILRNFSFFDAEKSESKFILNKMKNAKFDGKDMTIEETSSGSSERTSGRKRPSDAGNFKKRKKRSGKY